MTEKNNGGIESDDDPALDQDTHWIQAAQRHFEPDRDGELTTEIVFAIADAEGVSPDEVKSPPLYETIDVAAIEDAFFGPDTRIGSRQGSGVIDFRYLQYLVKVRSDGWVQVYESNETEHP